MRISMVVWVGEFDSGQTRVTEVGATPESKATAATHSVLVDEPRAFTE